METKNIEIQHQMAQRQLESTNAQVKKFQTQINEAVAKKENLERELTTQKEIMTQFEQSKKDYIDKLKMELETVDERFEQHLNRTNMVAEDARSMALRNFARIKADEAKIQELRFRTANLTDEVATAQKTAKRQVHLIGCMQMEIEDYLSQVVARNEKVGGLTTARAALEEELKEAIRDKDYYSKLNDEGQEKIGELTKELGDAKGGQDEQRNALNDLQEEMDRSKENYEEQLAALKFKVGDLEAANKDLDSQAKIEKEVQKEDKETETMMLLSHVEELENALADLKERLRLSEEQLAAALAGQAT